MEIVAPALPLDAYFDGSDKSDISDRSDTSGISDNSDTSDESDILRKRTTWSSRDSGAHICPRWETFLTNGLGLENICKLKVVAPALPVNARSHHSDKSDISNRSDISDISDTSGISGISDKSDNLSNLEHGTCGDPVQFCPRQIARLRLRLGKYFQVDNCCICLAGECLLSPF